jgi:hypothetical protein
MTFYETIKHNINEEVDVPQDLYKAIFDIRILSFTPLEIMPRSASSRNDWNF